MSASSVTEADLISWVEKSLENENLSNYEITLTGKSEKGDGYIGDIVFVNVNGTSKENGKKAVDLVIKHAKSNDHLRKATPIKEAFEREIHFYDKIIPTFTKFQLEKNVHQVFESVPKCYKTVTLENMEALVLDNLKKRGYELHDRLQPLNLDHLKEVLRQYGKFHALSFALKDQKKEEFDSLAEFRIDIMKDFLNTDSFRKVFQTNTDEILSILQEKNELSLFKRLKDILEKDTLDIVCDLLGEKETQCVIAHGDSWNNNFMFQYQSADRFSPSKVAILDWQILGLRSPAMDLSYFIYANGSKETLDKFDELMEAYYASFSHFLRELGSNPEELFSFSDLRRHWRKYSLFGFLFVLMILPILLCNKEDAPALEDLREGEDIGTKMFADIVDKSLYYERAMALISHYFEYDF